MSAALKVLEPGLCTTVQDLGRYGHQAAGVPVSGALDTVSLRMANRLVGNAPGEAALEILLAGPTIEVGADSVRVALAGTRTPIEILGGESARLPPWRSAVLRRGQVFRVGMLRDTACCYLAVDGGFDLPACLGSLSTYVRGGLGGMDGRALARDDAIPLRSQVASDRLDVEIRAPPDRAPGEPIRVVLGPQQDFFTEESIDRFVSAEFTISPKSDRMGLRLEGPRLEHRGGFDIVSDGIALGAIQVPGTGQPIVLLADHQTTGGYPKIATVISADVPALGRRRAGEALRFAAVDVATAETIRRAQERALEALLANPVPVQAGSPSRPDALLSQNLISGIVDALDDQA